ncbi:MAG TPA: hypothetical protein PLH22_01155 [Candidatus Colwellbacteria bacterium]|nr:hypothetical protein [Candidatus Colwellbacteria bacterium]
MTDYYNKGYLLMDVGGEGEGDSTDFEADLSEPEEDSEDDEENPDEEEDEESDDTEW